MSLGVHAIGIPGDVKGYFAAKKEFGNPEITMERLMRPTIETCEKGITITRSLNQALTATEARQIVKNEPALR